VGKILTAAVLDQQVSADKIRQTRADLMRSCPETWPHGSNLAPARKSPTFSSGSTVLQGKTRQVVVAGGERQVGAHAATTIPWNGISQE